MVINRCVPDRTGFLSRNTGFIEPQPRPAIRRMLPAIPLPVHEPRLHSRQSGARGRGHRHAEDAGRRLAALCALGAAAGTQGHGLPVPRPRRVHREIFRDRARPARARLRGRDARLARAGRLAAAAAQSAQGLCAPLRRLRHRSRDLHARGRAAGLSAAGVRARAFDGRDRADPRRVSGPSLVRPHGAAGAADRPAGPAPLGWRRASRCARCG